MSESYEGPYGWVTITLHNGTNPVLKFDGDGMDEPFLWGFATIDLFRSFLAAMLRFDKSLEDVEANV